MHHKRFETSQQIIFNSCNFWTLFLRWYSPKHPALCANPFTLSVCQVCIILPKKRWMEKENLSKVSNEGFHTEHTWNNPTFTALKPISTSRWKAASQKGNISIWHITLIFLRCSVEMPFDGWTYRTVGAVMAPTRRIRHQLSGWEAWKTKMCFKKKVFNSVSCEDKRQTLTLSDILFLCCLMRTGGIIQWQEMLY